MKQEGEAETQYCQDPRPWICNTNKRNIKITEVLSKEQGVQSHIGLPGLWVLHLKYEPL